MGIRNYTFMDTMPLKKIFENYVCAEAISENLLPQTGFKVLQEYLTHN